MSEAVQELYEKHAPRWIKVIQWNKLYERFLKCRKQDILVVVPVIIWWNADFKRTTSGQLYIQRPSTEEEIELIRRNTITSPYQRDWQWGQYEHDQAPYYDLAVRRQKYPEYYEGRYDGFKRYDV